MGITSVGARGTATSKTSGANLSLSPTSNIPAGALVAVWAGFEGNGEQANHVCAGLGCYDDAGNIYAAVSAMDFFAGGGPYHGIFLCHLQYPLLTTNTITLHYKGSGITPKAASIWQFALDDGMTWACTDRTPARLAGSGAIGGLAAGSLDNQEYLFLYGLCISGPATDTINYDVGWTPITLAGTTGGLASTNRTVAGEFLIQTNTAVATGVTDSTAGRDYTESVVAICQTPAVTAFPTTGLLDNFDRADENPLDNGTWDTTCSAGQTGNFMRLLSDRAACQAGGGDDGSFWTTQLNVDDAESFVTVAVGALGAVTAAAELFLHNGGCRASSDISGFEASWDSNQNRYGSTLPGDVCYLGTRGGFGDLTNEYAAVFATRGNGSRVGLRKSGQVIFLFVDTGGGFYLRTAGIYINQPGNWSGQAGHGKIGIGAIGAGLRLDDFGGGASIPPPTLNHLLPILGVGA